MSYNFYNPWQNMSYNYIVLHIFLTCVIMAVMVIHHACRGSSRSLSAMMDPCGHVHYCLTAPSWVVVLLQPVAPFTSPAFHLKCLMMLEHDAVTETFLDSMIPEMMIHSQQFLYSLISQKLYVTLWYKQHWSTTFHAYFHAFFHVAPINSTLALFIYM